MRRVLLISALAVVAAGIVAGAALSAPGKARHHHAMASGDVFTHDVMAARQATLKYATNLKQAKADGYQIITQMIPNMGFHYMNPTIGKFNLLKPQILVYEHRGHSWQLGALEWVFTSRPAKDPIPGAQYGAFPAACHYVDGTFVPKSSADQCPATSPDSGAAFNFWHPDLVTLHFWVWYPNPAGFFNDTNPLLTPFNGGSTMTMSGMN
jgi:hypothetical protein